ncbi:MAG: helicase HerA domain-containing protein, partial [Thermoproteus sp. AZ2]
MSAGCSEFLGLISRQVPSAVALEGARVYMVSGCDSAEFPVGEYLVVEDRANAGKRYLARVAESRIEDIYAVAKTPVLSVEQELSIELRSVPRLVALDLIAECVDSGCRPVATPVSIHSKVRRPRPGEASAMLGLPMSGVELGLLALPNGSVLQGDRVVLPLEALREHVLVVGTTGSGKTTLLKNLAADLAKLQGATAIALDVVGHYHHLALDGISVRVLYPVTGGLLRRLARGASGGPEGLAKRAARGLAKRYFAAAYRNFGFRAARARVKVRGARLRSKAGPSSKAVLREVGLELEVVDGQGRRRSARVALIPWALRTADVLYKVDRMTGLLTQQAKLFYSKVVREVLRSIGRRPATFEKIYEYLTSPSEYAERGRTLMNYEALANRLGLHV